MFIVKNLHCFCGFQIVDVEIITLVWNYHFVTLVLSKGYKSNSWEHS